MRNCEHWKGLLIIRLTEFYETLYDGKNSCRLLKKQTEWHFSLDRSGILFLFLKKKEKIERRAGPVFLRNPALVAPKKQQQLHFRIIIYPVKFRYLPLVFYR